MFGIERGIDTSETSLAESVCLIAHVIIASRRSLLPMRQLDHRRVRMISGRTSQTAYNMRSPRIFRLRIILPLENPVKAPISRLTKYRYFETRWHWMKE
jgi:hypothetical protein